MQSFLHRKLLTGAAVAGLLASPLFAAAAPAKAGARAYLGMAAEAVAKDATGNGVTVHSVMPHGPAGKAGLKSSDRIVMADGKDVKTFDDLKKTLANHKPGDQVAFKVLRDDKEQTLTVTLGEAATSHEAAHRPTAYLGVHSQALTSELKEHLGVGVDKGVLVTNVLPESPAAKAGLQEEDVITHFGGMAVNTPEELRSAVYKAGAGKDVTLKLVRGGKALDVKVQLQEAPAGSAGVPHGRHGMPEHFNTFPDSIRPFFSGIEKVPALEKKLQDLENRVRELEGKARK